MISRAPRGSVQLTVVCYYADQSVVSARVTLRSLVREMIDMATVVSGNADSGKGGMDRRVGRVAGLQVVDSGCRMHLGCYE